MVEKKNFETVALMWLTEKEHLVKRSTYSAYYLLLSNHLIPFFGPECDIIEPMVQNFVFKKLDEGLSQKYVKDILVVMNMVLKYGSKNGYMEYHKIDVKYPTERERKEVEVLSLGDQQSVMSYLKSNLDNMNIGIYICLCAGLRIGEICALKWSDIDLNYGVIRVSKTIQRIYVPDASERHTEVIIDAAKTINSIRSIPIAADLRKMLKPLKKSSQDSHYVLTESSDPIEPRAYRNYYNRLMNRLGLPKLKFHGLRHSFATRCIESQCDYKTVSVLLGHSNISTTLKLYVHPNMEQKQRCVDQMFKSITYTSPHSTSRTPRK